MNPHKATGLPAQFQTRDEADKMDRAAGGPGHEVVRKGETFNSASGQTLHGPDAITADDIRIVVTNENGVVYTGPWNKPAQRDAMTDAWDTANPID